MKIRSPCGIAWLSTSSEKVIVATPLGPNQAMKAFSARSTPVPASAIHTATVRATSSVTSTTPTAAQPSVNSPSRVSSEPKTTKTPSLTISMMSLDISRYSGTSGRRMPRTIAHTKTAMTPLPCGGRVVSP